jgi:lysyl-tRNA synthetase class 1
MIRFLFSGTKPSKAFEIPFESEEIFQRYDNFDRIEEDYFNPGEMDNERKEEHQRRVYELAMVEVPEEKPVRVPFKHLSFMAQTIPEEDWNPKAIESLKRTDHVSENISEKDVERVLDRLERAKNWAREYAPEDYVYQINYEAEGDFDQNQLEALELLKERIEEGYEDQDDFDSKIFEAKKDSELGTGAFFNTSYQALLNREQGPRLSRLIMSIGDEKAVEIIEDIIG